MKNKTNYVQESPSVLEEFFIDEIKDIYWAEKHLTKALPKLAKASTSADLKKALTEHLTQTEDQVNRLENIFEMLGEKPQVKKCDAMEGLISEGESIVEATTTGTSTRDVGIIMAAQKVEHYEIATYGALVQLAKALGKEDVAAIFATTLAEEKKADLLLTTIAEGHVNTEALKDK